MPMLDPFQKREDGCARHLLFSLLGTKQSATSCLPIMSASLYHINSLLYHTVFASWLLTLSIHFHTMFLHPESVPSHCNTRLFLHRVNNLKGGIGARHSDQSNCRCCRIVRLILHILLRHTLLTPIRLMLSKYC